MIQYPRKRRIRIGIDVGGTFTHAIAMDTAHFALVAQTKVRTTHRSEQGVARGVTSALNKLLEKGAIGSDEVSLVAHSTTQATNALLEGDVAKVGIIGMGRGLKSIRVRRETNIKNVRLPYGRILRTCYRYLDTSQPLTERTIREIIVELQIEGAEAIVAAEAFSVDHPENELKIIKVAGDLGLPATATHQLSQLYGLRIRTRTAVINASILPVMIQTAELTEESLEKAGIDAPLMIMRSDGGVMDAKVMRERPILTMLSGPAASVAAAQMYSRATDAIFLDVGGTSTDISVIQNGEVMVRTARVGKHKLHLNTLDVRTVGVAGGSIPRVSHNKITDIGPRSAHKAGMLYESFSLISKIKAAQPTIGAPIPADPVDYIYLSTAKNRYAVTLTGAANLLGLIPAHDHARGGLRNVSLAFDMLGRFLDQPAQQVAEGLMEKACSKIVPVIRELIQNYKLDHSDIRLLGTGGAASVLVPYIAQKINVPFEITQNNSVYAAIGVALAMVRETIERNIASPTEADLLKLRQEVETALLNMGAHQETMQVTVEVDSANHIARAVATGSTDPKLIEKIGRVIPTEQRRKIVATALNVTESEINTLADNEFFTAFSVEGSDRKLFGMIRQVTRPVYVVDNHGILRLSFRTANLLATRVSQAEIKLREFVESYTRFGDSGARVPGIHLAAGPKLFDFTGLVNLDHILALGAHELSRFTPDTPVLVLAERRN